MNNDGGPAYPVEVAVGHLGKAGVATRQYLGLSVRDYFAAAALPAIIQMTGVQGKVRIDVAIAYEYADYMLAERDK